jgi:hypothetical protein
VLEAGEQHGLLGARAALVLDGPGQGEQRSFAEDLGYQVGMLAAQVGEHRALDFPVRAVAWLMAACRLIPAARRRRTSSMIAMSPPS